jgi:uncharacterized membrane protein YphA (DoxX/SURF4 family)
MSINATFGAWRKAWFSPSSAAWLTTAAVTAAIAESVWLGKRQSGRSAGLPGEEGEQMQGLYPGDASIWDSVARLLIVGFFMVLVTRNLQPHQIADHIERLQAFRCPMPRQAFWAGVTLEAVGCVLVLFNWYPAVGVVCLMTFTILATALLLRFWEVDNPGIRTGMQNGFFANFAVLGGLILLLQKVS